jgi:hypothetical protein
MQRKRKGEGNQQSENWKKRVHSKWTQSKRKEKGKEINKEKIGRSRCTQNGIKKMKIKGEGNQQRKNWKKQVHSKWNKKDENKRGRKSTKQKLEEEGALKVESKKSKGLSEKCFSS